MSLQGLLGCLFLYSFNWKSTVVPIMLFIRWYEIEFSSTKVDLLVKIEERLIQRKKKKISS